MGAGLGRRERNGDRQSPPMAQQVTHSKERGGRKKKRNDPLWRGLTTKPPYKRTPGQPGRPTHHHTTEGLWGGLKTKPGWPTSRKDQAELISSHWPEDGGEPPASGTIANHIRQLEREAQERPPTNHEIP
jgi:hypothetical protein